MHSPERTGPYALAVDIGGSTIAAGLVDHHGTVTAIRRIHTPDGDALGVLSALTGVIDEVLAGANGNDDGSGPVIGVGLACAGPIDVAAGTVSPVNIPSWRAFPLRERIARRYRLPVALIGDAVAVAVGEHFRGAARGVPDVMGMVVSTGIGGGLVLGGRAAVGATGNAGHLGHVSVDPNGPACRCGGIGCVETVASGTAIGRYCADRTADRDRPITTAAQAATAAAAGDGVALAAFDRAGAALGQAIAGAVTLLDVSLVVIGGGVAAAGPILFDRIDHHYRRFATLDYARAPRIVAARLGTSAGLVGAGAVVVRSRRYRPDVS